MKRLHSVLAAASAMIALATGTAHAQYYQLANQAANMITTAAMGGLNYRGYVDAAFAGGVGRHRSDVLEITTTQGMKVNSHFFIGVGAGVQLLLTNVDNDKGSAYYPWMDQHSFTTTGVAIPLFSDFRYDGGSGRSLAFFADLKIGASFMTGNDWIRIGDGYIYSSQCFYMRPTVGMRIPVSTANPKMALSVGLTYSLLTSGSWYMNHDSVTLNAIGVNVGFEW